MPKKRPKLVCSDDSYLDRRIEIFRLKKKDHVVDVKRIAAELKARQGKSAKREFEMTQKEKNKVAKCETQGEKKKGAKWEFEKTQEERHSEKKKWDIIDRLKLRSCRSNVEESLQRPRASIVPKNPAMFVPKPKNMPIIDSDEDCEESPPITCQILVKAFLSATDHQEFYLPVDISGRKKPRPAPCPTTKTYSVDNIPKTFTDCFVQLQKLPAPSLGNSETVIPGSEDEPMDIQNGSEDENLHGIDQRTEPHVLAENITKLMGEPQEDAVTVKQEPIVVDEDEEDYFLPSLFVVNEEPFDEQFGDNNFDSKSDQIQNENVVLEDNADKASLLEPSSVLSAVVKDPDEGIKPIAGSNSECSFDIRVRSTSENSPPINSSSLEPERSSLACQNEPSTLALTIESVVRANVRVEVEQNHSNLNLIYLSEAEELPTLPDLIPVTNITPPRPLLKLRNINELLDHNLIQLSPPPPLRNYYPVNPLAPLDNTVRAETGSVSIARQENNLLRDLILAPQRSPPGPSDNFLGLPLVQHRFGHQVQQMQCPQKPDKPKKPRKKRVPIKPKPVEVPVSRPKETIHHIPTPVVSSNLTTGNRQMKQPQQNSPQYSSNVQVQPANLNSHLCAGINQYMDIQQHPSYNRLSTKVNPINNGQSATFYHHQSLPTNSNIQPAPLYHYQHQESIHPYLQSTYQPQPPPLPAMTYGFAQQMYQNNPVIYNIPPISGGYCSLDNCYNVSECS